jgi:O-glycosyl hydrolase
VSAPDENTVDATIESYRSYDPAAKDCISQINTHGYWLQEPYKGSKRGELWDLAQKEGKTLWMSEFGAGRKPDKESNDTASALRLSRQILDDMQQMHPTAWVYWQAVDHSIAYNTGLISLDDPGHLTSDCRYVCTKRYYAMANYSRFIRPGYQIIGSGDPNTLAAYDLSSGTLVLVTTNDTEEDTYFTYDLSNFSGVGSSSVQAYRTSDTEDLVPVGSPLPEDITPVGFKTTVGFRSYVPRESITTYIIPEVCPSPRVYYSVCQ